MPFKNIDTIFVTSALIYFLDEAFVISNNSGIFSDERSMPIKCVAPALVLELTALFGGVALSQHWETFF